MQTRKRYTELDKAYISKYFHIDGPVSLGYALDRTYQSIQRLHDKMIRDGELEQYQKMWEEQFKG